ncbi:MAG: membrane protein insertion efficiency factor YidD [Candidatus Korobacteraceae bacterium]
MEAVERYGVVRGLMLAAGRLSRCHPFARAGLDLVPQGPAKLAGFRKSNDEMNAG